MQFANSTHVAEDLEKLFTLIALNCALRNGDAHLKNFGIIYDDVQGEARLAPVYDLVTTSVYLAKDSMALTLNGSTRWPAAKELRKLGEVRASSTPAKIRQVLERGRIHSGYIQKSPSVFKGASRVCRDWAAHFSGVEERR